MRLSPRGTVPHIQIDRIQLTIRTTSQRVSFWGEFWDRPVCKFLVKYWMRGFLTGEFPVGTGVFVFKKISLMRFVLKSVPIICQKRFFIEEVCWCYAQISKAKVWPSWLSPIQRVTYKSVVGIDIFTRNKMAQNPEKQLWKCSMNWVNRFQNR